MTIDSCLAGKDVYVEKPLAHNLRECQLMVEVASKTDRVVQMGVQRRSQELYAEACAFVRSGAIGKVAMARCWIAGPRPSIGHVVDSDRPAGVDWNLFLGPAPLRPFNRNRFHYRWRWFWDTGTGEIGNNGVHILDIGRWGLGAESPTRVVSAGGQLVHDDDRETPDTQLATFEFPGGKVLTWEHRIWSAQSLHGLRYGVEFLGERGSVLVSDGKWQVFEPDGKVVEHKGVSGWQQHVENFIECVGTRGRPNADVETAYRSTSLCLLANITHRLGETVRWDGQAGVLEHPAGASRYLGRDYRSGFELPEV